MSAGRRKILLREGQDEEACGALDRLLGEISTMPVHAVPFIAPLLLMAELPEAAALISRPAGAGRVLVHESLALEGRSLPVRDEALLASVLIEQSGESTILSVSIGEVPEAPSIHVVARLREVAAPSLGAMKPPELLRAARGAALARRTTAAITQDLVNRYVALTGDRNLLHADAEYARAAGLGGTVIPGALLAGLVEPLLPALGVSRPLTGLRVRFAAPHPVGDIATYSMIAGSASDTGPRARVFVSRSDGGVTAIADVSLV